MLNMKTLYESLLDDDLVDKTDEMIIKDEIKSFLKANYNGSIKISKEPNADGKYEVSSSTNIEVKNKKITSLTNGMFIWETVGGYFSFVSCNSLKSLNGSPKKVGGDFSCTSCRSLKTLKGAPEEVRRDFD